MDNATNNDTMIRAIERSCHKVGIKFSATDARGRCMPHTIHLAAIQVFLVSFNINLNKHLSYDL